MQRELNYRPAPHVIQRNRHAFDNKAGADAAERPDANGERLLTARAGRGHSCSSALDEQLALFDSPPFV
jgi:hypothetical protein